MLTTIPGRPLRARGPARNLLLSLALVLSGGSLSACTSDASPSGDATAQHVGVTSESNSESSSPPELATTAEIGRIVGRLPGTRRKAVRKEVTAVIDRWWEAAYLSGAGRTTDVGKAFPGFTVGARKRATFDRDFMSNVDLEAGPVTPLMRKARLDLLAVDKRVRSVTARFDLRLRVPSERNRRLRVHGRVFLTQKGEGWQVFGYDVSKGWL